MFKRSRAAEGGRERVTGNAVGTGSKKREGQACSGGIAPEFKSAREVQCETPELSKCFFQLPAPLLSPGTLSACTDLTNSLGSVASLGNGAHQHYTISDTGMALVTGQENKRMDRSGWSDQIQDAAKDFHPSTPKLLRLAPVRRRLDLRRVTYGRCADVILNLAYKLPWG